MASFPHQSQEERRSDQVVRGLRAVIASGSVPVGARLPSEVAMCDRYGVSRTVIREAIAQLRSEGLVTARRGSGLYVTETPMAAQPAFAKIRRESLADTIELLELRSAVEREAAALAAERASPAQKEAIFEAHSAFMEAGAAQTVELDLAFHL
ncbi:MAG: GntR family transcriptional regulator, partial [Pseudomonadota bacterium]